VTRRLLLTYLTITAFALVVVVVPLGLTFAGRERDQLVFDLERDAQAVGSRAEDALEAGTIPDLTSVFANYEVEGSRIIVVDDGGISVADSGPAAIGRDYSTRPEIETALAGERTSGERLSTTLGVTLVYVAVPVASQGVVHGAVRITLPTSKVDERIQETWLRLGGLSAVVLLLVGVVGLILARSVTRPVRQVEEAARQLAAGDLAARAGNVHGAPELASLARQFDATAERLEHLVDAQRRFVGDASHQLRTPLAALRLRLETLQPSGADEPRVAAALAETDRLSSLVESLLVIARSESGAPQLTDVDLVAIAEERRETWQGVADRSEVELIVVGPARLEVRAVNGAVEQILDNLLSNALNVAEPDTSITVELQPPPDGGGGRMVVTDQGPGMTPDQRARATARFWRPPGATGPGSGLGLSIVDHLVMAGGGQLTLDAGPAGVGLQVTVDFAAPGSKP